MAKVLQIRRGTTAQNDNFTGLAGEVTMDTDTKTLRVHDGQTLGGFTLARSDDIRENEFDITNVSDDFWSEKIAQYTPQVLDSIELPVIDNTGCIETCINTTNTPLFVQVVLMCKNDDAGYTAGDKVCAFGIGNRTNPQPNTYISDGQLFIRLFVANESWWVSHRSSGITTNITDENWAFKFRVYC